MIPISIFPFSVSRWLKAPAFLTLCAVAGCASAPAIAVKRDATIARDSSAARFAYDAGDYLQAANFYERAMIRAQVIDDRDETISNAISAAIVLMEGGKPSQASLFLLQARYEAADARSSRRPEIDLLLARAGYAQGQLSEADDAAMAILADSGGAALIRGLATVLRGNVACDRNDAPRAATLLAAAESLLAQPAPEDEAELQQLRGKIEKARQNFPGAAKAFDAQAQACRRGGHYAPMASAMAAAGAMYAAAHQADEAADRYYRAALIAAGLANTAQSRQWLTQAAACSPSKPLRELIEQRQKALTPASAP